jgi:hypothetical protein
MTEFVHRIFSSQTVTPRQLKIAGLLALEWWLMDHVWFIGTVFGWW